LSRRTKLITADIWDISGDQLAALDTKAEAQPNHMNPELNQFMCGKRVMARAQGRVEVREAFDKQCTAEEECFELLEFLDGDHEADKEDNEMFAQELTILLLPKVEYYDIVNYKTGKLLMGKARTLTKSGQI
jgi:hypothetical protein